jgi:hypothetical protein
MKQKVISAEEDYEIFMSYMLEQELEEQHDRCN